VKSVTFAPLVEGGITTTAAVNGITFFAYPGKPSLGAELMNDAATQISGRGGPRTLTWQGMETDGRYLISTILGAIDSANTLVADVGSMNSNVLFEVGYALTEQAATAVH